MDSAGKFYVHKPLQVEGEATFNKPVAFNKTVTATDITATGTINANGGINLSNPPATNNSAVNADYAGSLSFLAQLLSPQFFLRYAEIHGNSIQVNKLYESCWELKKISTELGTVKINYHRVFGGTSNYSGFTGFWLPISPIALGTGKIKFTFIIGYSQNVTFVRKYSESLDLFTLSPTASSVQVNPTFFRLIDVTFDTIVIENNYYPIRVREIIYDKTLSKFVVYETKAKFPSFNTNPSGITFLTYQQSKNKAGLWIYTNGLMQQILRLADLHPLTDTYGFNAMETIYCDIDSDNLTSYIGSVHNCYIDRTANSPRAYFALENIETRSIISTTTYDFTPYE